MDAVTGLLGEAAAHPALGFGGGGAGGGAPGTKGVASSMISFGVGIAPRRGPVG